MNLFDNVLRRLVYKEQDLIASYEDRLTRMFILDWLNNKEDIDRKNDVSCSNEIDFNERNNFLL